jgi:hypothetical protein
LSNYIVTTDFAAKDALPSGNPGKLAQGTQIDVELDNIAVAIATKEDTANKGVANGYVGLDASARIAATNMPAHTGDVTSSAGSVALTVANDAVTNAKMANMAQNTVKGRITASTGDPEDITAANLVSIILAADGTGSGLDADLVDGQHASAFAASSHNHAASEVTSGTFADARIALSNVSQHAGSIKCRNLDGVAGVATTVQADPGGTPSGSPGDFFFYY